VVLATDQGAIEGAIDQEAVEGAMEGARDASGSIRRRDGWCKKWIREQYKERRVVRAGAMEGVMDGSSCCK
jgi:outer membrane lipoprotein SlyB